MAISMRATSVPVFVRMRRSMLVGLEAGPARPPRGTPSGGSPMRVRGRRARVWAALPALLAAVACQPAHLGKYDIVLVSIDTLRADRLGTYGYGRPTSPNLDALASQGAVFENVLAEAPWTLPSHLTMLTGLHPETHGVTLPTQKPDDDIRSLAQILQDDGYRTFGFTAGGYVGRDFGFDRGFDVFDDSETGFRAKAEEALLALRDVGKDERFFLFLHTFDVHCPYVPEAPWAGSFASPDAQPIDTRGHCGNTFYNVRDGITDEQIRYISDRYDEGILQADATLGWLLAQLGEERLRRTIVVVTSDHGEEFREHGKVGHEAIIYREVLAVPWILRAPGVGPRRVPDPVELSDLMPTVLELAGLAVPEGIDGRSRAALLTGPAGDLDGGGNTARFSSNDLKRPLRSVMTRDWHLIVDLESGRNELYAIARDPGETHDLSDARPNEVERLRGLIDAHARGADGRDAGDVGELSPERREQLRALGYSTDP